MLKLRVRKHSLFPSDFSRTLNINVSAEETAASSFHELAAPDAYVVRDFSSPYLELVRLLREAAEVEHALMLQYLYAGFSLKVPAYIRLMGFGTRKPSGAPSDFLGVAIEEMVHLNVVNGLLVELGASPHLERQDFPYETDIYPFPLNIEPLSRQSVAKYTYVEAPPYAVDPDHPSNQNPASQAFLEDLYIALGGAKQPNQLGSLYRTIIGLVSELATSEPDRLSDPQSAIAILKAVMEEGEEEHYKFFRTVFLSEHPAFENIIGSVWDLPNSSNEYPVIALPENPSGYRPASPTMYDHIAWLSDLHYWTALMLLDISYRLRNGILFQLARDHMTLALKPLALYLASVGHGIPFDRLSMGYSPGTNVASSIAFLGDMQQEITSLLSTVSPNVFGYDKSLASRTREALTSIKE